MKKTLYVILAALLICGLLSGCKGKLKDTETWETKPNLPSVETQSAESEVEQKTITKITLSDSGIIVDGEDASTDSASNVYVSNDIVYYMDGQDFKYGEGDDNDAHSAEESGKHTVINITKAGEYSVSGKLSYGQIAVDLGEEAADDPETVVTLVLDGVDITCTVAPAVIFYSVYECGSTDTESASAEVDTAGAGARVLISDGSTNTVNGSYVAKIYKPGTLELSEDGAEVLDAKKLHKYDGAFYSRMSMRIDGGEKGDGILNINAENEGLGTELHLTINGGVININSGNDGINTNEDNVSVTTVNGGILNITVNGDTGEGDGIDSNGWLVINGGTVISQACAFSGDAGIDSDCGIHINGGVIFSTGNMLDAIGDSTQTYAVFTFQESQSEGTYTLKNADGEAVVSQQIENSFRYLIVSSPEMIAGEYSLTRDDAKFCGVRADADSMGGMGAGAPPKDMGSSNGMILPEGMEPPAGMIPPDGAGSGLRGDEPARPEGEFPESGMLGGGQRPPERPDGTGQPEDKGRPEDGFGNGPVAENIGEVSDVFVIEAGENYFVSVREYK